MERVLLSLYCHLYVYIWQSAEAWHCACSTYFHKTKNASIKYSTEKYKTNDPCNESDIDYQHNLQQIASQ